MSVVPVTKDLCDFIAEGLASYELIIPNDVIRRRISYDLLKFNHQFLDRDFDINLVEYEPGPIFSNYFKVYDPLLYSCIHYYEYQNMDSEDYPHAPLVKTLEEYLGFTYEKRYYNNELDVPWGIERHSQILQYKDEQLA